MTRTLITGHQKVLVSLFLSSTIHSIKCLAQVIIHKVVWAKVVFSSKESIVDVPLLYSNRDWFKILISWIHIGVHKCICLFVNNDFNNFLIRVSGRSARSRQNRTRKQIGMVRDTWRVIALLIFLCMCLLIQAISSWMIVLLPGKHDPHSVAEDAGSWPQCLGYDRFSGKYLNILFVNTTSCVSVPHYGPQ